MREIAIATIAPLNSLPLKGGGLGRGSAATPQTQSMRRATPAPTLPLSGGGGSDAPAFEKNEITQWMR
jgi:hypothetical protein